jgi:predicted Zn-dependent peptidase
MQLTATLLALLASSSQSGALGLLPDTTLQPPNAPRIVAFETPGSERVALHLFVPLHEKARESGAGRVLARLAGQRATGTADRIGTELVVRRLPMGIAYSIMGSPSDLDHLAWALRVAVSQPESDPVAVGRAVAAVADERARRVETGPGYMSATLAGALCASAPGTGTPTSLGRMTSADLEDLWRRTHQAERMTLVVASGLPAEVLLAAVRGIGAPPDSTRSLPSANSERARDDARPAVLRRWYGEARVAGSSTDPRIAVAAELMGERAVALAEDHELFVELVRTECHSGLLVYGAAYRAGERRMRARVQTLVAETREALTEESVVAAARQVERRLLLEASTLSGQVALVGRALAATGRPEAAAEYVGGLSSIDRADMLAFLDELLGRDPMQVELR